MYKKHPVLGYWVSEDGFLMRKKGCGELKSYKSKHGYLFISDATNKTSYSVHRIVYEAFYGKIAHGLQVNHINGIKVDNRLRNLELVTPSENIRHAVRIGLKPGSPSESNSMAKLKNHEYYQIIFEIMSGETNDAIAKKWSLHSRYVSLIRGKKRLLTVWQEFESKNGVKPIPRSGGDSNFTLNERLAVLSDLPKLSNKQIAEKYGIEASIISRVRSKKTWRNVWSVFQGKV